MPSKKDWLICVWFFDNNTSWLEAFVIRQKKREELNKSAYGGDISRVEGEIGWLKFLNINIEKIKVEL